jgi:hypothetical protein
MSSASEQLAEEFTVIPYPFVGEHRDAIEAEYAMLLNGGVKPAEVADLILHALEILLNKRKKAEGTNTYDETTAQVADMLGRLSVFEEMFSNKKYKKSK